MQSGRNNLEGPCLELVRENLVFGYFSAHQEAKYDDGLRAQIVENLTKVEDWLTQGKLEKDLNKKSKLFAKAKSAIKKVIALNPGNSYIYFLLPPVLLQEYHLIDHSEERKQLIKEAIEALETNAKFNKDYSLQCWLYIGFIHFRYGNKKQAKKTLEYILENCSEIDWRNFLSLTHVFAEYVLPNLDQIDSIKALIVCVVLYLELSNDPEKTDEERTKINNSLEANVVELLKRPEDLDLSKIPSQFDEVTLTRKFIDYSNSEDKHPLLLKNRILLFLSDASVLYYVEDNKAFEKYQQQFKDTLISYMKLNLGRFPLQLPKEQYKQIIEYIDNVEEPYVVIAKLRLQYLCHQSVAILKNSILKQLARSSKDLRDTDKIRLDPKFSERDRRVYQAVYELTQSAIIELEILYTEALAIELEELWTVSTQYEGSFQQILTFPKKHEQFIKKIEDIKNRIIAFNLPKERANLFDKFKGKFEPRVKLVCFYKEQIECKSINGSDIAFIEKYKCLQKEIFLYQGKEYKSEETFDSIILEHRALDDHLLNRNLEQAIAIGEQLRDKDPDYCYSLNTLARAYSQAGRAEEALAMCERSISIYPNANAYWLLRSFYKDKQLLEIAEKNLVWALCLEEGEVFFKSYIAEEDHFFSDLIKFQIFSFTPAQFLSANSHLLCLQAANDAFDKKYYAIAFKYYSLALWVPEIKPQLAYIIKQRAFSLSLISEGLQVEMFIINSDLAKLKKISKENYTETVIAVAKSLWERNIPSLRKFATQLLNEISNDHLPARILLNSLLQPEQNKHAAVSSLPAVVLSESNPPLAEQKEKKAGKEDDEIDMVAALERKRAKEAARLALATAKQEELKEKEREQLAKYELEQRLAREEARAASLQNAAEKRKKKKKKKKAKVTDNSEKLRSRTQQQQQQASVPAIQSDSDEEESDVPIPAPVIKEEPAPRRYEEITEQYYVELPLNLVRKLNIIGNKLGRDRAFITGGFVEKIVLGKPFSLERDVDFVTDWLLDDICKEFPEFIRSNNSERTLLCPKDLPLNIPRLEIFHRKFLVLDIRLRNFISKTFRIIDLLIIDRQLAYAEPEQEDRNIKVKVVVTVSGLEEAFKSIQDMTLRLPPGVTEKSSFTTDATRIIQAVTTCCKDGYSDKEINLKPFVHLIGKIITDKEEQHKLKSLKKTVKEAFTSGHFVPILQRWFELEIANHLFGKLVGYVKEALPFINIILKKQDEYNRQDQAGAHSKYGLVVIIASAIFSEKKGKLDAPQLAKAVSDYLAENLVFNDFIKKAEFITATIVGNEEAKHNKSIFVLLKNHFEPKQKDQNPKKNEKKQLRASKLRPTLFAVNNESQDELKREQLFQQQMAEQQLLWGAAQRAQALAQAQHIQTIAYAHHMQALAEAQQAAAIPRQLLSSARVQPGSRLFHTTSRGQLLEVHDPNPHAKTELDYIKAESKQK